MKIFCRVIFFIALYLPFSGIVETFGRDDNPVPPQNKEILRGLSDSLSDRYWKLYNESRDLAAKMNLEPYFMTEEGVIFSLQRIENGTPFYFQTYNLGAAITNGASQLYPGEMRRLFVTGRGYSSGLWDAGRILSRHPELLGRVVNVDDTSGEFNDHATHVAGTILSQGIEEKARGMAYESQVRGFNWQNDLAEMADEALKGMIISNHSYGIALGWSYRDGDWVWMGTPDAQQDYRFGFYNGTSRALDMIAFNAPHYLIVWAAGNDRSDVGDGSRPSDGPYDTIGSEGVAKNVLTVGAVENIPEGYNKPSDVKMTSFSSWGPTDDGRIKPDIVAKGRNLYSTTLNNSYALRSGTSMSAPVATGSLLLVQQLYNELSDGQYLRSASLKGLAIHTAKEAGENPGPDYSFGWGLLDVSSMADFLIAHDEDRVIFLENLLENEGNYSIDFYSDGQSPIIATLSWTDPPGIPGSVQLNPRDLKLINDLDMRLVYENKDTLYPWILDVEKPQVPAITGDNIRDNVEKIWMEHPQVGNYELIITHKDTLTNGHQHFSLFVQTTGLNEGRQTLYWIGGDGNWEDGSKWSFDSGGTPANIIPGQEDHVVIDHLSFNSETESVYLNHKARAYTLSVNEDAKGVIELNGNELLIANSLYAFKDVFGKSESGTLIFNGSRKNGRIYFADEQNNSIEKLVFDNPEGTWRVFSELPTDKISLRSGNLIIEEVELSLKELIVDDSNDDNYVQIKNAVIDGLHKVVFPKNNFFVDGSTSIFIFDHSEDNIDDMAIFSSGGMSLKKLVNTSGLQVIGHLNLNELINHSSIELYNDMEARYVSFNQEAAFIFNEGVRFIIGDEIYGSAEPSSPVQFISNGSGAVIEGKEIRLYCFDHLHISKVSATGSSLFNAGLNSSLVDSEGWLQMDCDNVLFADFYVESPCVHSWTKFYDSSSGPVTKWNWQLSDQITSIDSSFVYTFTDTGHYDVILEVTSNDQQSHTNIKEVFIDKNPFSEPRIVVSGGNLLTVIPDAPQYQWYRDNKPIEGATSRSYRLEDNNPSIYTVLISNGICNRPSINEINTGIPDMLNKVDALKVFPNPATDWISILSEKPVVQLNVYNLLGRLIYQINNVGLEHKLDISSFKRGIYLIKIEVENAYTIERFVVY